MTDVTEQLDALWQRFEQLTDEQRQRVYTDRRNQGDLSFVMSGAKALAMAYGGTEEQVRSSKLAALERILKRMEEACS